jgi:hypothetical protein
MDPTQAFSSLFTPAFWILVVIIGLLIQGFKFLVEQIALRVAKYFPDKWEPNWQWLWREVVLPVAPVVLGCLIGVFISEYPYPDPFNASMWPRMFVGTFAGFVSAWAYPRIMYYVRNQMKTPGE